MISKNQTWDTDERKKTENIREQNFKPKVRSYSEAHILHKMFALTY